MAFQKKNWQFNDIITEGELNRMEDGIEEGITKAEQAQQTADSAATAAANAQSDIDAHKAETVAQGVHGMGSIASQDYEEGTWTPEIIGFTTSGVATYQTRIGSYIKIGNLVFINANIAWSNHTGIGQMTLRGLPFVIKSNRPTFSLHYNSLKVGAGKEIGVLGYPDSLDIRFWANDPNGGVNSPVLIEENTTILFLGISGFYTI